MYWGVIAAATHRPSPNSVLWLREMVWMVQKISMTLTELMVQYGPSMFLLSLKPCHTAWTILTETQLHFACNDPPSLAYVWARHGIIDFNQLESIIFQIIDYLSRLGGRKGIRPVNNGGWGRWALPGGPDGVAPGRIVGVSASGDPFCTIGSRGSLLAPAHPGGPGKRAVKGLWWVVVVESII